MLLLRLSRRAVTDLVDIADFTRDTWGETQALSYLADMQEAPTALTASPGLGRQCDNIRAGLRRLERNRHVIFYQLTDQAVVVSRILHQSILPATTSFPQ